MTIKIGKASDNDIVIDDSYLSRYHAVLTIDDKSNFILEDSNSTNGTFVNDIQIIKKKVVSGDKVTFGKEYTLTISEIMHTIDDYSDDFSKLKSVYDKYIKEKIRIQSSNQFKTRLFQSLPFAFVGIVGVALGFMGHANKGMFIVSLILAVCAPTIGVYFGARQAAKIPALLQNLANQFKIDYVCPKCGTFLGEIPYESLYNKKQCPVASCKAKWVRTPK
jgi:ribosomal protein L37AE/L43A